MIRAVPTAAPIPCRNVHPRHIRCGTIAAPDRRPSDIGPRVPAPSVPSNVQERCVSSEPPAKFFVNRGIVSSRTDMHHLLRPLLKQTVSYRYLRGRDVVDHGTGWVERVVFDQPDVSTYFTPLAICLNIDSFEHLEFETRPDQLIVYALIQGDERVEIEFAPLSGAGFEPPAPRQLEFDTSGFVQMELLGPFAREDE